MPSKNKYRGERDNKKFREPLRDELILMRLVQEKTGDGYKAILLQRENKTASYACLGENWYILLLELIYDSDTKNGMTSTLNMFHKFLAP